MAEADAARENNAACRSCGRLGELFEAVGLLFAPQTRLTHINGNLEGQAIILLCNGG
jgi:hypothetical protein